MIKMINKKGVLAPAPDFEGWITLGLDLPVRGGDVFVCLSGNETVSNPNTSNDIIFDNNIYGKKTPREHGESDVFCVYRKRKWRRLDNDEGLQNGDLVIFSIYDPALPKPDPNFDFDYLSYGQFLNSIPFGEDSKILVSFLIKLGGSVQKYDSVWRDITNTPIPPAKLPGNAHYGKPLPLP